jgi:hypothetical protein
MYGCVNANDYSIYQHGIYKLSLFQEFNPFTSVRDLRILSDHFDPILYIPAVLVKIFGPSKYLLMVFEWFVWIATMGLVYVLGNFHWKQTQWIKTLFLIVWSKNILMGLLYPAHPTVWSIFPLTLLAYSIIKENKIGIVCSILFCFLFKELFIFMTIGLSGYYLLIKRDYKFFATLFLMAVGWYYIAFILRPSIYGSTVNYGNSIMSTFFENPLQFMWMKLKRMNFYPTILLPPFLLMNKDNYKKFLPFIFFMLPGLAIHILAERLLLHHSSAIMSIILLGGLLLKTRIHGMIIIIMILVGMGRYTKTFKMVFTGKVKYCRTDSGKLKSIDKSVKLLKHLGEDKIILSSNAVIPQILGLNNYVLQYEPFTLQRPKYDILVLEKHKYGAAWPLSWANYQDIAKRCRPIADRILQDDEYVTIMEGHFTDDCIQFKKYYVPGRGFRESMHK